MHGGVRRKLLLDTEHRAHGASATDEHYPDNNRCRGPARDDDFQIALLRELKPGPLAPCWSELPAHRISGYDAVDRERWVCPAWRTLHCVVAEEVSQQTVLANAVDVRLMR